MIEAAGEPLTVADIELVGPGHGEVLVRVQACGICRSDLHVAETGETVRVTEG